MQSEKFSNIIQLNEIAGQMDKPFFSQIFTKEQVTTQRFRAIVSSKRPEILSVVSQKYRIVQSSHVVQDLISALHKLGISDVSGSVVEQKGKSYIKILLPKFVSEGTASVGKDIQFGFILQNSYDAKKSLSFSAYAMRLVCSNGMTLNQSIGQVFVKKHMGDIQLGIQEAVQEMLSRIVERSEYLQSVIDKAVEEQIEVGKDLKELLAENGFSEKVYDKVRMKLGYRLDKASKWDVYNALTNIFSLKKSTEGARLKNLDRAEKLLVTVPEVS